MIEKLAKHFNTERMPIEALNRPTWAEINVARIKVASIDKSNDSDLGGFDLEAAIKDHPEHLFVKVFAIKKDEPNDNGDAFNEEELKKAAQTFIGVPVFTNHQNDDIEKAKGKVVHAWYDTKKGGIYIISMIDKLAYPRIARGIEEGYINGTSMGAQVQYSLCSICHNKAHTADEYCSHVKSQKNRKVSSRVKCAFHDSKCKPDDEKCPLCGCKKGESKYHEHKQAQVYEWNYGIKFIEDSLVVNPACHDCLIDCVLNVPVVKNKFAEFAEKLKAAAAKAEGYQKLKVAASEQNVKVGEQMEENIRIAGRLELEKLNEAMGAMEIVARSMMDQKQQVSLEYVSDIVEVLSDLQQVTDELVEMGYGALPSPPTVNEYIQNIQAGAPAANATGAVQPQPQQPQQPAMPNMAPPSSSPDASGLATITKPTFKGSSSGKKEEIVTAASNIRDKIEALRNKLAVALAQRDAAQKAVADQTNKESEVMDKNTEKTAAGPGQTEYAQQVITEKVLDQTKNSKEMLHPRTETHPEGITQSDTQLGRSDAPKDVKSDSPQTRYDDPPTEITEAQMEAVKGDEIVRHNDFPEVITEKQWTEISRAVASELSTDQSEHITQSQLRDLLDKHTWTEPAPDYITEQQLSEGGFGDQGKGMGSLDRLNSDGVAKAASYQYDAKKLLVAAQNAIADAIAGYSKSPEEIVKAAAFINRNPQAQIKASYLMLVNAIPAKREARKASRTRNAYFAKLASEGRSTIQAVDALVACMSDNCTNLKAEDFVEAVGFAASDKTTMAKIDELVRQKLAARNEVSTTPVVDKFSALREAAAELDKPEDGMYQVLAAFASSEEAAKDRKVDFVADPANKRAFVLAAEKFAASQVPNVKVAAIEVRVNEKAGTVATTLKDVSMMTAEETAALEARKTAAAKPAIEKRAAAREQLVKEGQFGGMPDQMGGAPGAGAGGMPGAAAPAGGPPAGPAAPPVESFDQNQAGDDLGDTSDSEPKPPGSVCPACSSQDVDIVEGKGKCKACGAEFTYKVQIDVTKWPNTLDKGESAEGEEGMEGGEEGAEGGEQGEGFAMPEQGGADQSIPVAAMTRLSPDIVMKLAEIKDRVLKAAGNAEEMAKIAATVEMGGLGIDIHAQESIAANPDGYTLGRVSPLTGSVNTMKLAGNAYLCLDSGTPYVMETAIHKSDVSKPFFQWKWLPKVAGNECSSCRRMKKAFSLALQQVGKTDAEFEALDLKARGELILQMKAAGAFKTVKTASTSLDAYGEFKKAYAMPADKFPSEACREKIARRFGKDAVAMSGPCEGKNLADCVCKSLKKAEVYADYLAIKVASVWAMEDASASCLEDFIRLGYGLKEAATCCEALKTKYAQSHEYFLDKLADFGGFDDGGDDTLGGGDDTDPFDGGGDDGGDIGGDSDPFDGGAGDAAAPADDAGAPADPAAPGDPAAGAPADVPTDAGADAGAPAGDAAAPADINPTTVTGPEPTGAPEVEVTPQGNVVVNQEVLQALETLDQAVQSAKGNGGGAAGPADVPAGASAEIPMDQAQDVANDVQPVVDQATGGDEAGAADAMADAGGETPVDVTDEGGDLGGDAAPVADENTGDDQVADGTSFKEGDEAAEGGDNVEDQKLAEAESLANSMRKGVIGRTGQIKMDLSGVMAAVQKARMKVAGEGKELKVQPAQDAVPGKVQNGGTMGNEEKFKAEKPDVPTNESKSTMGNENPPKAETPKIPTGDQRLGHEDSSLKPELADKVTGGAGGAGGEMGDKVASAPYKGSTKDITYRLAERLMAKKANDVKVDDRKPTMKTDGIGKIQDGKVHPNSTSEEPVKAKEPEIPEKNKGAFMGHEEESIKDVPKATSEFAPEVPTEGDADKVDEIKGTKIAAGDMKSLQYKEAMRVAGRMVAEGLIGPDKLLQTVDELRELKPSLLKAYEIKLFSAKPSKTAAKGLKAVQDGTEQPVVIHSNDAKKASLSERIAKCFTLSKQLDISDSDSDADVRRKFNR